MAKKAGLDIRMREFFSLFRGQMVMHVTLNFHYKSNIKRSGKTIIIQSIVADKLK